MQLAEAEQSAVLYPAAFGENLAAWISRSAPGAKFVTTRHGVCVIVGQQSGCEWSCSVAVWKMLLPRPNLKVEVLAGRKRSPGSFAGRS